MHVPFLHFPFGNVISYGKNELNKPARALMITISIITYVTYIYVDTVNNICHRERYLVMVGGCFSLWVARRSDRVLGGMTDILIADPQKIILGTARRIRVSDSE